MKAFQILIIIGGLLLIGAVYALIPSVPYSASHDGTLVAGGNQYLYDKVNILRFGHLGGQFSEANGQALRVYVFTEPEYTTFQTQSIPQGLFLSDGPSSGTVSAALPSPGNYYLVFMHGSGLENTAQNLTFSISLDGYNPVVLAAGLGLAAAGVISLVVGYRLRNKYFDEKLGPRASDVITFDKPSPTPPLPSSLP